uniref:Immunoglobulin I-set domain-containing protein n=1 Tax=Phlebotomus papatasi TaxID=29031 RepID=A0A1B0DH86_PHLPP
MVTRDERVRLIDGYNLEITELEPQDAGDYVCQISDKINKDQVHTVEILGLLLIINLMLILIHILGHSHQTPPVIQITHCHPN